MGSAILRKGLWVLISCILNAELNTSQDLEGIFQDYGSKKTQRFPVYHIVKGFDIQLRFSTETCNGQLVEITSEDTNHFLRIALPDIGPIRVSYSTPNGKSHSNLAVSLKGEVCDGKRHSLWLSIYGGLVSYGVDKVPPVRFYVALLRRLFPSPANIIIGKGLKGCVSDSMVVLRVNKTHEYRVGTSSGCSMNKSCSDELGMQNKRIANERITASSSKSTDNSPHFARLDGSKAWCSALCDKLPNIQIQLEEPKIITEIITQGSSSDRAWATKYEVRFLENGKWKEYNEELTGNNNVHGYWSNILDPPIRTQLIRIYPKNPMTLDYTHPKPYCLRLELYGCSAPGSSCQPPISPYGSTIVYPAQRGNHKNGSVVVFGCKQGLYLTGLPIIKCNGNTWTAVNFKCLLKCNEALDIHRHSIGSIHSTLNTLSIEVHLRKGNVITAASVHLEDIRREDQQIQIRARISNRLVQINHFKPRVGEEEEKLKLSRPVITQSLQIWLIFRKGYNFSMSRTPRVFGCKSAVFRGCIMSGSAVLFREGKSYLKGSYVSIAHNSLWEVLYGDKYLYKSKDKVLLDEKPNLDEIPEGTAIVGEDPRGNLREGKIKRLCSSIQCTIETEGEEWQSKLENVRVFRKELCENHMMT